MPPEVKSSFRGKIMFYSSIGYYALIFGLFVSFPIFFFSIKNFKNNEILDIKIISFSFIQLLLVFISFLGLILSPLYFLILVMKLFLIILIPPNHYFIKFLVLGVIMREVYYYGC